MMTGRVLMMTNLMQEHHNHQSLNLESNQEQNHKRRVEEVIVRKALIYPKHQKQVIMAQHTPK